jgi:hypothetical protein
MFLHQPIKIIKTQYLKKTTSLMLFEAQNGLKNVFNYKTRSKA